MLHPDYSILASRILVSRLHKYTNENFAELVLALRNYKDIAGRSAPLISERVNKIVQENAEKIQEKIQYSRDFEYDFFGLKTLFRAYLLKMHDKMVERP